MIANSAQPPHYKTTITPDISNKAFTNNGMIIKPYVIYVFIAKVTT